MQYYSINKVKKWHSYNPQGLANGAENKKRRVRRPDATPIYNQ